MKRIKRATYSYLIRRQKRIERRRRIVKILRKKINLAREDRKAEILRQGIKILRIQVPETITCTRSGDRKPLLNFIKEMRESISDPKNVVILDFSNCLRLSADGMILIYAELHRLMYYFNRTKVRIKVPEISGKDKVKKEKVAEVLQHLGLLDLLGSTIKIKPHHEDVIHWQHASGQIVDMELVDPVLALAQKYLPIQSSQGLRSGVSEAMDNCLSHAYTQIRYDGLNLDDASRRSWFGFSELRPAIDGKGHTFSCCLCDLGVGIPRTLPATSTGWVDILKDVFAQDKSDGRAIKYALEEGQTRTDTEHRGKGLPQLVRKIQAIPGAQLTIHSNKGVYNYIQQQGSVDPDYADSILGTLII